MATRVLTIASQKGGVSKSCIAINLAAEAMHRGVRAVILEVDRQGTASSWAEKRSGSPPVVRPVAGHQIATAIAEASRTGAKLVVIDLPGTHGPSVKWAIRHADFVLIPSRANDIDLEATIETRRTVADEGKRCAYVLTLVPPRGDAAARQVQEALEEAGEMVAPVLLPLLNAFPDATAEGETVREYEAKQRSKSPSEATKRIADLWSWTADHLEADQAKTKARK